MKAKKPLISVDAIEFEDCGETIITLSSGIYIIDDEVVEVKGYGCNEISVKDTSDIREVTTNKVVKEYVCGDEVLSVLKYNEQESQLLSKRQYDGDDEYSSWESLDDEFVYRKFKKTWSPIYIERQEISEPLIVSCKKVRLNTGNPFIETRFTETSKLSDTSIYSYRQTSACIAIVEDCFKELGMDFNGDCSYGITTNKKVWGNSNHSGIRYVTAFGTYVFNDSFKTSDTRTGELSKLKTLHEENKAKIRKIIIEGYNKHFGKIDDGKFDFDRLLNLLNKATTNVNSIDSKVKTADCKRYALNQINEAVGMIQTAYTTKKEDS